MNDQVLMRLFNVAHDQGLTNTDAHISVFVSALGKISADDRVADNYRRYEDTCILQRKVRGPSADTDDLTAAAF